MAKYQAVHGRGFADELTALKFAAGMGSGGGDPLSIASDVASRIPEWFLR